MKIAVLAVALGLALPGVAQAGTVSLDLEQTDFAAITRENLNYRADRGELNRVTVRFDGSSAYTVTDSAGVTAGRQCDALSSTRAVCRQSSGSTLGTVVVRLGDRNDRAALAGHGGLVLGQGGSDVLKGSGFRDTLSAGSSANRNARARTRDRLSGRGGGDFIYGSSGPNRIDGGEGFDTISAGRGGDLIRARDRRIDQVRCGGGADRAILDTADFLADRCRSVSRPGTPAATPIDLFTSDLNAFVIVGCPRDALLKRCRGSVSLRRGARSFGRRRFDLARGRRGTERFRLPEEIVDQFGPRGGPRVRITVRSTSGVGKRTTFFVTRRLPPPGD